MTRAAAVAGLLLLVTSTACEGTPDAGPRTRSSATPTVESLAPSATRTPSVRTVDRPSVPEITDLPAETPIHLDRLPTGAAPGLRYIANTDVITPPGLDPAGPGGYRTPLEKGLVEGTEQEGRAYFEFARFADGWMTQTDAMGPWLVVHAWDGSRAGSAGSGDVVATTPDGMQVLTCCPAMVTGPVTKEVTTWNPSGRNDSVAGFLRNPEARRTTGSDRWDVVFTHRGRTFRGHSDGTVERFPVDLSQVTGTSVAADYVVGFPRGIDRRSSGVFDARTGRQLLRAPGRTILSSSPTGRLLISTDNPYGEAGDLLVGTLAGKALVRLAGPGRDRSWSLPVWEDRRHFLFVAQETRGTDSGPISTEVVVRVGLVRDSEGQIRAEMEKATGPSSGDHYDHYVLPAPWR